MRVFSSLHFAPRKLYVVKIQEGCNQQAARAGCTPYHRNRYFYKSRPVAKIILLEEIVVIMVSIKGCLKVYGIFLPISVYRLTSGNKSY